MAEEDHTAELYPIAVLIDELKVFSSHGRECGSRMLTYW
jgi:hypothetical protein